MYKVVLVNDDIIQLKLQERYLEEINFKVYSFENPYKASKFLSENIDIDIIITDLHMPEIDGWQFCQLLRSKEYETYNNIPVMLVSATSEDIDLKILAQTVGADAFLKVPYSKKEYISIVNDLLALKKKFNKILVIDNGNLKTKKNLKELKNFDYTVKSTDSIEKAFLEIDSFKPDFILIDNFINNKNIVDILPEFRIQSPDSIIVVMTNDSSPENAAKILLKKADIYIRKPFSIHYLNEILIKNKKIKNLVKNENLLREKTVLLERTHSWYKKLLNISNIVLFKLDEKGGVIYINEVGERILNISNNQIINKKNILSEEIIKDFENLKKNGMIINKKITFKINNIEKNLLFNIFVKRSSDRILFIEGIAIDITELTNAQKKLAENHNFYQSLLKNIPDYIAVSDNNGILIYSNKSSVDFNLKCKDNFIYNFKNITEDEKSKLMSLYQEVKMTGLSSGIIIFTDENNNKRYTHVCFSIIKDLKNEKIGFVQIIHDETERYMLEKEMQKSHEVQIIGRLTSGIAHDYNNLFGGILGYIELLKQENVNNNVKRKIDIIEKALLRGTWLTNRLQTYTRINIRSEKNVDINKIIYEVYEILKKTSKNEINFDLSLEKDIPLIKGDPKDFEQIILNLCVNSIEAVSDNSKIQIISKIEKTDNNKCLILIVKDNGNGIVDSIKSKIFQPFFSSKKEGAGTGLGLSIVSEVVRQYKGHIDLKTEVEKGSEFKISIPIKKLEINRKKKVEKLHKKEIFKKHILIVDDENIIRDFLNEFLQSLNYIPILAENGEVGLMKFRNNLENIFAVILDINMPVMGGEEAFRKMKRINSNIPIIISTGFALSDDIKMLLEEGAVGIIKKPHYIRELTNILNRLKNQIIK